MSLINRKNNRMNGKGAPMWGFPSLYALRLSVISRAGERGI